MIEARKNPLIEKLFAWMNRNMIRKHFFAHRLRGEANLSNLDRSVPVIFYANHSSWWDGFIAFHLSHDVVRMDGILMMDGRHLMRYRFFRWIGAFSVDREDQAEAKKSIQYAVGEMAERGRVLWMYPQGEMPANDIRPLTFFSGLARIAKALKRVQLVPVAHRYEFVTEERPEVFTSIGRARTLTEEEKIGVKELVGEAEKALTAELDALRQDVIHRRLQDFSVTLAGKRSVNVQYDLVRGIH